MSSTPGWFEDVLRRQLTMNRQTWAALQEHGVDASSEIRLDFFYVAPGQPEAEDLGAFLRTATDYRVDVDFIERGVRRRKLWSVTGSTQPTSVSPEILDQWVRWMVAAGAEHGGCEFDGWGAAVT